MLLIELIDVLVGGIFEPFIDDLGQNGIRMIAELDADAG